VNENGASVYYSVNPVSAGRGKTATANDGDVLGRWQYFIDIDPERQNPDKKVMSTDQEKAAAFALIKQVRHFLETVSGWPVPMIIDSGSGWHLLYQGDGSNVQAPEWTTILKHISKGVSTKYVKVDTVVTNPSRIARLPGTLNRKGEDTPERPWRRSHVVEWAPDRGTVTCEMLQKVAAKIGPPPREKSEAERAEAAVNASERDILSFCKFYDDFLNVVGIQRKTDHTLFRLDECPFSGRRHAQSLSCIVLRPDTIGFKCLADGCLANERGLGFRHLVMALKNKTGKIHRLTRLYMEVDELAELYWGGIEDLGPAPSGTPQSVKRTEVAPAPTIDELCAQIEATIAEPVLSADELCPAIGATLA
jgi:hypothetical protein